MFTLDMPNEMVSPTRRQVLKLAGAVAVAPGALAGCLGGGASSAPTYEATIAAGRSLIHGLLAENGIPAMTIALVDDQRIIWSEAFGRIDAAGTVPTPETRFPIASATKVVTAVATMILVDRGVVELDAPFVRYVPAFRMASPDYTLITVRMLLCHASGLPGDDDPNGSTFAPRPGHAERVLAGLASRRLKHAPGEMAVYCNDGFTLVELLVRAVTGKTFIDFVRDEILLPLGMTRSTFTAVPLAAGSYAPAFRDERTTWPLECLNVYASGGLYSTPEDMGKLARMLLNRGRIGESRLLSEAAVAAMAADQTRGLPLNPATDNDAHYGLGWDGIGDGALAAAGVEGWHKNGATVFQGTELLVAPREKLAVMVMASSGAYDAHALAQEIVLRALVERGSIPTLPAPVATTPRPVQAPVAGELAALAGIYAQSRGLYQVGVAGGDRLALAKWGGGQWSAPALYALRDDGKYSSDDARYPAFSFPVAGGRRYLLATESVGAGWYAAERPTAHRIDDAAGGTLLPQWQARVGRRWVAVTFDPTHTLTADGASPHLALERVPGLSSYVMVSIPALQVAFQVVDPRSSADRALMCLKVPLIDNGRDLADLVVVSVPTADGAEEWLGWNATQFRPLASIIRLAIGSARVAIGAEGYAEWRRLPARATRLAIAGSRGWKVYRDTGASLELLDQSLDGTRGDVAAPADAYLLVHGAKGAGLVVEVSPA